MEINNILNKEKNGVSINTIDNLYKNHYKDIYKLILYKVHKAEIAEELTQDVFIKANEHLANYDVLKAKITTWLYTIANNKVIDYYRANKNNTTIHVSDFINAETGKETYTFIDTESTESMTENSELKLKIEKAISTLKPNYKRMAELFFYENKQYSEIAIICNTPIGTVKGNLNRCRIILQEVLQKEYANL
jgi:RNA polymerase sigma factor (sigma-70 family)